MTIEQELGGIDFSGLSKVRDSLLARINNRRAMERMKNDFMRNSEIMSDEELDEVAAAGNPAAMNPNAKKDFNPPKIK